MRTVQAAIQVVTLRLIGWMAVAMTLGVFVHIAHRHQDKPITWADSWREAGPQVLAMRQEPTARVAPRRSHRDEEAQLKLHGSKSDGTLRKLEWYEREAYPAWTRAHPGRTCPATLDELNAYIGVSDSLDLWGHPIEMQCGPKYPLGFTVLTAAEDGIRGTGDDFTPF